jgi:16S rRNA processing protein RimM
VGGPFGVKGWVKIRSLSGETAHLLSLNSLNSLNEKKGVLLRRGEDSREYVLEGVSSSPLAFKFLGIDSPEAAKELRGAEILLPRENAAPLNEGEFYIEDPRGLKLFIRKNTDTEEAIGSISDMHEGGGGFLAEILLFSGEKKLVPFRNEFFGPVDPASGRAELLNPWILE